MECGDGVGLFGVESGAEGVGEQVVVAVPTASVVEGREEDVAVLEAFEGRLAVGGLGEGVAEGAVELLDHGRVEEEAA